MKFRLRAGDLESLLSVVEFNRNMSADSIANQGALLRRWEVDAAGNPTQTAYLLTSNGAQPSLPSLADLRENYRIMTGGGELPIHELFRNTSTGPDLLATLNVKSADGLSCTLNSEALIRSIWNQNHNYWVDRLKADTSGSWTEDQYFQAARAINMAEHQQAAFSEIAHALANGTVPGASNPANSSNDLVSDGLAAGEALVALFSEHVSVFDGTTGEIRRLALSDTFSPAASGNHIGTTGGDDAAAPMANGVVLDPLPGWRTGLPDRQLDLGTIYSARSRDGVASGLNQVRGELFVLTGLASLQPYTDWADFQERNQLSDDVIQDLKVAYPEGIEAMDLWVGGLAEAASQGQLGSTLAALVQSQHPVTQIAADSAIDVPEVLARTANIQLLGSQSFASMVARHVLPESAEFQALFEGAEPTSVIAGDASDNVLTGTDDDDLIIGGGGGDVLFGLAGDDELRGGAGDDVLDGGAGADTMIGGTGNDTFRVDNIGDIVIEAEDEGIDTVETTLESYVLDENVENLEYEGTASFTGVGNEAANIITGGASADTLLGAGGDDTLDGGGDSDTLLGGTGNDTYVADSTGDIVIELLGEGTDTVVAYVDRYTLTVNVENLENAGGGYFVGTGNLADNTLLGAEDTDVLFGLDGNDTLIGGGGADLLYGGLGNDALSGGDNDDHLFGDASDAPEALILVGSSEGGIILGSGSADVIEGSSDGDVVFGGAGSDAIYGDRDDDRLDGGSGNDYLNGGRGDDDLIGGVGDDSLYGDRDNDTLLGGEGNDYLDGGKGDDRIEGGEGRNLVNAGEGNDWIINVSGQDTIVLKPGFGNDYVAGFDASSSGEGSQNKIDVSSYGFDESSLGFDILVLGVGDDTVITIGSDTLTLLQVNATTIDRNDFIFS